MEYVHLLQNYIVSELIKNEKIESADFKVSFKDLVLNYNLKINISLQDKLEILDYVDELINRYPEAEKYMSRKHSVLSLCYPSHEWRGLTSNMIKEFIHYEPNKAISTFKKKIKI